VSKPFLVIQLRPEDETADNELAAIKRYGGLGDGDVVRRRAEQTGLAGIRLDEIAAIIVGGSPFDISSPVAKKSAIQLEIEAEFNRLLDQVTARDFPFLGCCSGNGLLGNYCGASISTKYAEDVGGANIHLTDAGRQDPLLRGMPPSFRVLLGHKEACDSVPPDCVLLATNSACPVQMFRLQNNIYATQFHPEGDTAGFIVRINHYKNHGYFAPETAQELAQKIEGENTPHAHAILSRFVARFRV